MNLKLTRPLVFFDLETTGTDTATDKVTEIFLTKYLPGGGTETLHKYVNPEKPIPAIVAEKTRLTNEFLQAYPNFKDQAPEIHAFMYGADLAGYNLTKFDVPLLVEEFYRCGLEFPAPDVKIVDAFLIFARFLPRTLAGALQFYTGEVMDAEKAHGAAYDVEKTVEVLAAQMERHGDKLPADVDGLSAFCAEGSTRVDWAGKLTRNEAGAVCFNFGKWKGRALTENFETRGYCDWMLSNNFPGDTKRKIKEALNPAPVQEPAPVLN